MQWIVWTRRIAATIALVSVAFLFGANSSLAAPSTLPFDGRGNHPIGHGSAHLQLTGTLGEPRPLTYAPHIELLEPFPVFPARR